MPHQIDWKWIANGMLIAFCVGAGGLLMVFICFVADIYPDYSTFWTAARVSLTPEAGTVLYDPGKMTELQSWLVRNEAFRPWAYPPTALLMLLPFAPLSFWWSLAVWSGINAVLYFAAAWFFSRSLAVAVLASLSFSALFVAIHGHLIYLVAAMIVAGLALLARFPVLAGVLLGIAATIKPQTVILVPWALIAGRHYSALMSSLAAGVLAGTASALVFGVDLWLAWLRSLPTFLDIVRHNGISDFGVTPVSITSQLGLHGTGETVVRLVFGITGIVLCWCVFRNNSTLTERLVATIGGGFLVLPYAMGYELITVAPAAAMYVLADKRRPVDWCLAVLAALVLVAWWSASVWISTAFTLSVCTVALMAKRQTAYFLRAGERLRA